MEHRDPNVLVASQETMFTVASSPMPKSTNSNKIINDISNKSDNRMLKIKIIYHILAIIQNNHQSQSDHDTNHDT